MKYNGKEVTEDFADSVRSRVTQNTDKECEPETWEVMAVLQAAEEVFAEMEMEMEKEARVKAEFDKWSDEYNAQRAIRNTLNILGITVKGINVKEAQP